MELRLLRSFVCVAEEQNIGRAALRLHISQPPLTRQIQALEHQLGAVLLTRGARGVELTDAGRVLYDEARLLLAQVDRAAERTQKAAQGLLGRIDIALFGSGIFGVIPQRLRRFRELYPDVSIVLHSMSKDEQIDALRHHRITVAFNRLMRPIDGLTSVTILNEALFVAVASNSALASKPELLMHDLQHEPLVLYPTGSRPSFIDWVQTMCTDAGFVPMVAQEVGDVVHALALVGSGFGSCVVAESATHIAMPGLTFVPLRHSDAQRVDLCCIHRSDDDSALLQAFLRAMQMPAGQD